MTLLSTGRLGALTSMELRWAVRGVEALATTSEWKAWLTGMSMPSKPAAARRSRASFTPSVLPAITVWAGLFLFAAMT